MPSLTKINLFRGSLFKQARFMMESPQNSQDVLYITEAGTVSIEPLPVNTGFMNSKPETKKTWMLIHSLKFTVCKDGVPIREQPILVISDRTHIPLDPNNIMQKKTREKIASLNSIAKIRHAARKLDVGKNDQHKDVAEFVMTWCFILCTITAIAKLIMVALER